MFMVALDPDTPYVAPGDADPLDRPRARLCGPSGGAVSAVRSLWTRWL